MTIPAAQAEVADLLASLTGAAPQETHISAVFVGADRVLKLRKAVRLSFVDFTTVAERRRTAHREYELSAPSAPGLYRRVLAVRRTGTGGLALDEQPAAGQHGGEPVDWVVEMARVPADDFLDVIAKRGALDNRLLDAIADTVAEYHRTLPAGRFEQAATLRRVIEGNAQSAREAGIAATDAVRWRDGALAALADHAPWFEARARGGFVRRAHGDLHLGNLCMWRGRPVPFDALEFDEELATIDVAYDLAFLLMDIEHRVGRPAANRVLNRYIARTGDHALVGGLRLFLSMRAMIRAHVEASRGLADSSRAYLEMAHALLADAPASVVAIGGLPGTGKSTLARALAPERGAAPGAVILRSDEIRKRLNGRRPEERLPASAYHESVSRAVLATLCRAAADVACLGHAAIADATFMAAADRRGIAAAAERAGVAFAGAWLHAPLAVLEDRIDARRDDASDATVAVLRRAAAADPGAGDWIAIDATDRGVALAALRAAVGEVTLFGGRAPSC